MAKKERAQKDKEGVIEVEGRVLEALPNAQFRVELTNGVLQEECAEVLRAFFRDRR